MKKHRLLSILLAFCFCFFAATPVAFAEEGSLASSQRVAYAQANTLPLGTSVEITGTPNYNAYTHNDSTTLLAIDTPDGTWFAAIGPYSVDAFRSVLPSGEVTLFGVYAGSMDSNNMPILDIQQGTISYTEGGWVDAYTYAPNITIANAHDLIAAGQEALDKAAAEAAEKAAQEAAAKAAEEAQWKKTGKMVWISTLRGECYHTHASCSNMVNPEKVDLGYAKYMGYRACKKCYR